MKNKVKNHSVSRHRASPLLNAVGGAAKLRWNYDSHFKQWWIPNAGGGFQIIKEDLLGYELRKNNRYISNFNKLSSAKMVAQLMWRG